MWELTPLECANGGGITAVNWPCEWESTQRENADYRKVVNMKGGQSRTRYLSYDYAS